VWAVGGYSQTGETVKEEKAQKLELAQHFGEQEWGAGLVVLSSRGEK